MRRIAGNLLIGLSIVLMAAVLLWFVAGIMDFPDDPNEDQRGAFIAGLLFLAALVIVAVVLFLTGRHLRQLPSVATIEEAKQPGRPLRPLPLALYLGGSVGIALFTIFFRTDSEVLRPLLFLIGQPFILAQLVFGGLLGIKLGGGAMKQALIAATILAYFPALLYPLYGLLTTDRTADPTRYKRMTILLALLGSIHILIGLVTAILIQA